MKAKSWYAGAAVSIASLVILGGIAWRIQSGQVSASVSVGPEGDPIATAQPAIEPLSGPWVVALQPGHWEISDLPAELVRLRNNSGAQWGRIREVDINRAVVGALVPLLREKGWKVEVVPATVPPDLRADAFIAIHADSSIDTSRRGWKLSPPWRASGASRELARDLAASFAAEGNLVEDTNGVTVNMRGYFAFNNRRFRHAISPYTPAAIIELGFLSNTADRALLTTNPGFWARIIARGLERYFAGRNRAETSDLRPLQLGWMAAGANGATVRAAPDQSAEKRWTIDPGTIVMPVDVSGDWYEVFLRRHYATGWVAKSDLVAAENPRWPMPGERNGRSGGIQPAAAQ